MKRWKFPPPIETPAPQSEESLKQIPEEGEQGGVSVPEDLQEGDESESGLPDEKELFHKMWSAVYIDNDREAFNKSFDELLNFPDRKLSDEVLLSTKSDHELRLGVSTAEHDFIELEENNPEWVQPSFKLASFYLSISSLDKAETHAKKALERFETGKNSNYVKELLAQIWEKQGKSVRAITFLNDEADNHENGPEERAYLFDKIADINERNENIDEMHIALEKGLLLCPSDKSRRFRVAYSYAENEEKTPLAFWHYNILLNQDHMHSAALNNIGIIYRKYGIKGEGMEYWLRAADIPDAHAIGNIASVLIDEGFHSKAREYLNSVPDKQKIYPRINVAANSLENAINEEEKTSKKLDKTANIHQRFVEKRLKNSSLHLKDIDISGSWKSSAGDILDIVISQDNITISGTATPRPSILTQPDKKLDLKGKMDGNFIEIQAIDNSPGGKSLISIRHENTRHFRLLIRDENNLEGLSWVEILSAEEVTLSREN